jgi:hypothetical protein
MCRLCFATTESTIIGQKNWPKRRIIESAPDALAGHDGPVDAVVERHHVQDVLARDVAGGKIRPGANVMIIIFDDFRQSVTGENGRFSKKTL